MSKILAIAFVGLAAVSPICSSIRYRKSMNDPVLPKRAKKRDNPLSTWFLLSFAVLFFGGIAYESILPEIKSWFFNGYFFSKEVLTYPDEGAPFYETKEFFKFVPEPDINALGAFTFSVIFWFLGSCAFCYYFYSQYERKNNPDDNDDDLGKETTIQLSILKTAMGLSLVLCLLEMPYGYYGFIRWAIAISCIYLLMEQHKGQFFIGYIFLWCMIILFNPIVEIHLTRLVWNCIDVGFAVILFASAIKNYIDSRDMI